MGKAREPRRLELEIEFETQPIQGRLYDQENQHGADRAFSGWLGLMSAIEAAGGREPPAQPEKEEKR